MAKNWEIAGIGPEWAVTRLQTCPEPVFNLTVLHLAGGGSRPDSFNNSYTMINAPSTGSYW
jgi:hypothetical protein